MKAEDLNWINVMRNFLIIMIGIVLWQAAVSAQSPSDLITYQAPPATISLQNVASDSLMAISATNAELCPRRNWEIPTLGRYSSQAVAVEQSDNESIDAGLQKFAQGESKMPASVGNATGNITKINGTMVWM